MHRSLRFAPSFVLLALSALSAAQTRSAQTTIGATNSGFNLSTIVNESTSGGYVESSLVRTFTGLRADGTDGAMTLDVTASASAEYGRLHAFAGGTLTDAYQNDANPLYYDGENVNEDGSPDQFGTLGFARFTDTLTYGNIAQAYYARYTFFVDGVATGDSVAAFILAKIGSDDQEYLDIDLGRRGNIAQYVTTDKHLISPGFEQDVNVLFSAQFNPSAFGESTLLEGSADFSSTATLAGIGLYDANDNLVSGFTVSSLSGTQYPTAPVPEPATMAALGLAALATLRRRA